MGIDTNNAARVVVLQGLSKIPSAGVVLNSLTQIFWPPPGEDIWGMIRARVEALINQRISDLVYQQVNEDLAGLNSIITGYCGGRGGGAYDYRYEGHVLGSAHVMGISHFYGSANCVIFGFRLANSYA